MFISLCFGTSIIIDQFKNKNLIGHIGILNIFCLNLITGSEYPTKDAGVLRLYGMRFCPYVKRTHLVLQHKNIP